MDNKRSNSMERKMSVMERKQTVARVLDKKSVKKPVRPLKKPYEKWIRKKMMDIAPATGSMSTNDLFNKGYGNIVTICCQSCFVIVFIFYAYTNIIYNKTAQFLIPLGELSHHSY